MDLRDSYRNDVSLPVCYYKAGRRDAEAFIKHRAFEINNEDVYICDYCAKKITRELIER